MAQQGLIERAVAYIFKPVEEKAERIGKILRDEPLCGDETAVVCIHFYEGQHRIYYTNPDGDQLCGECIEKSMKNRIDIEKDLRTLCIHCIQARL